MNNDKMVEELAKIISELDTAVGMLILPAMKDKNIKISMEKVSQCSFLLGGIINDSIPPKTLPNVKWPKERECSFSHVNGISDCEMCHSCLDAETWNACRDACKKAVGEAQHKCISGGLGACPECGKSYDEANTVTVRVGTIESQPAGLVPLDGQKITSIIMDCRQKKMRAGEVSDIICSKFGTPALPSVDKKTILNCVRGVEVPYADSQTLRINLIKYIEDIATAIHDRLRGEK